ncbi:protein translocase subunit SecA [Acrasis kona]|uniref:Protein translocase subunit SecA n=1 Tax=Acrasis kona TaxID=1008807 RepID=A0AAW2ZIY9_9EUKA
MDTFSREDNINKEANAQQKHNELPNFKNDDANTKPTESLHQSGSAGFKTTYDADYKAPEKTL